MLRLSLRKDEVQRALDLASRACRGYATRGIESSQWDQIRDIGMQLFSSLFEGARMTAFRSYQDVSMKEGYSLRLRLCIEDPNLTTLPWEFMHDGTNFLGLSPRFSIVRTVMSPGPQRSLKIDPPLEVLVVTSHPIDMPKVLDREIDKLKTIIPFSTIFMRNPTPIELANALTAQPVHIFHYFGQIAKLRNEKQAQLLLTDETGQSMRLGADHSRVLLAQNGDLRLAYLSAQHSDGLAEELAKDLPAVIGIQGDACDEAIYTFTEELYRGLRAALTLEESVTRARQEIDRRLPGSWEWGLPVFYLQTSDSFLLKEVEDLNITVQDYIQTIDLGATVTGVAVKDLGNVDPEQAREWRKLQGWLNIQRKNLEELKKQEDALGPSAPLQVRSEIEITNKEIENLTKRLDQIQQKLKL